VSAPLTSAARRSLSSQSARHSRGAVFVAESAGRNTGTCTRRRHRGGRPPLGSTRARRIGRVVTGDLQHPVSRLLRGPSESLAADTPARGHRFARSWGRSVPDNQETLTRQKPVTPRRVSVSAVGLGSRDGGSGRHAEQRQAAGTGASKRARPNPGRSLLGQGKATPGSSATSGL
jgi:hypothetical protein